MTSRCNCSEDGFTLVEMLVVVAILALMTSLIMSHGWRPSPALQARGAALTLAGEIRTARSEAMAINRSVYLTIDVARRTIQSGAHPQELLPPTLQLSLLTGQEELASETTGRIRFDPDGASSGGRVSITGGDMVWQVGVDWLSGHVSVESHALPTR